MPSPPERKRVRIPDFDYAKPGAYYVTICTAGRKSTFGEVKDQVVLLTQLGRVVRENWLAIPSHFPGVTLDECVVMPNHLHGILWLPERAGHARPLPAIVGSFKSAVSRQVGQPVWQRSYFEHVIKTNEALGRIRRYIETNPSIWDTDPERR